MKHRIPFYSRLNGKGVEVGALHEPAPVPSSCDRRFFDVRSRDESVRLFDELDSDLIVPVDFLGDADSRDLRKLGSGEFDFAIANHVIEHLANPLAFVEDLFYIVKPGGAVILSVPDKRFTFDSKREITPFEHLLDDYRSGETRANEEHYLDFIVNVLPGGADMSGKELEDLLELVWARREHVHVWDTNAFRDFMSRSLTLLEIRAIAEVELLGDETKFEYFSVWRKQKMGFGGRLFDAAKRLFLKPRN